jgi:hypothetical protein
MTERQIDRLVYGLRPVETRFRHPSPFEDIAFGFRPKSLGTAKAAFIGGWLNQLCYELQVSSASVLGSDLMGKEKCNYHIIPQLGDSPPGPGWGPSPHRGVFHPASIARSLFPHNRLCPAASRPPALTPEAKSPGWRGPSSLTGLPGARCTARITTLRRRASRSPGAVPAGPVTAR